MRTFLIGLLVGALVGGVAAFLFFVGVPRASQSPGVPIKAPDQTMPGGTAEIVLKQDMFNEVLRTIFQDMNGPAFPLGKAEPTHSTSAEHAALQQGQCDGNIRLLAEGSGTRTALDLKDGRISVPLAFTGSYNSAIGCFPFSGWAQANFELRFDAERQSVFGRINVETVNLDGVNPLLNGIVTPLVQSAINTRVNPILLLSGENIGIDLPVASANGNLRARVRDVRSEVKDGSLHLFVVYDFSGVKASA